jgi:hypothetical protein
MKTNILNLFGKTTIIFVFAILASSNALGSSVNTDKQDHLSQPFFSIEFRKPKYEVSYPCVISHDTGTEFNPTCGRSWKLDKYDSSTKEFSFMEIELSIDKELSHEYVLELLACARKDPPLLSNVSISVNDRIVTQGYHMYNGPDSVHFPDDAGKPSHLRWDVFDISNELQNGINKIRISLDQDTQSGISVSWLHIRSTAKQI